MQKKNYIFIYMAALCLFVELFSDQFPFNPKHEITLLPGLGSLHHPVTTQKSGSSKVF